ncbi:hypothetical protein BH11BAC5_BH11BAC5_11450 [soil metagenome]
MNNYKTVSEALNDLLKRGYTENFTRDEVTGHLISDMPAICLPTEYYRIDELHRFEGMTDTTDEMMVFAISALKLSIKGVVVYPCGGNSDTETVGMVQALKMQEHPNDYQFKIS